MMRTLTESPDSVQLPRLCYTAKEAAWVLGVSPKTVYRLCARGHLKRSTALRTLLITKTSVQDFLAR